MQNILFRLDDICPRMGSAQFNRIKDIFFQYNVHPIIGVVPDCKDETLNIDKEDPEFWDKIRELQNLGWTVAMHGCFHVYVTKSNGLISHGAKSEFAGLPYKEQYEKIQLGKEILGNKGITTDVFMAPSHSYDKNTLKALKKAGFKYVTDGLTNHPYKFMGLLFVPCKESKLVSVDRLSTVCLHTNTAAEERFTEIERYLSEKGIDNVVSFYQAAQLQPKHYCISRLEEIIFYIKKYYIVNTAYVLYKRIKRD